MSTRSTRPAALQLGRLEVVPLRLANAADSRAAGESALEGTIPSKEKGGHAPGAAASDDGWLGDRRDDLRRVQDLAHFAPESLDQFGHVSQAFDDYLNGRADLHLHFGVRRSDTSADVRNFCARLKSGSSGRAAPFHGQTPSEFHIRFDGSEDADGRVEASVLVLVRHSGEPEKRVIGGIPSRVELVRLPDVVDDGGGDAWQTACHFLVELDGGVVGRELDAVPGPVVFQWPTRTVEYELPCDVVEDASIVVEDVSESGGERSREVGNASIDNQPRLVDVPDTQEVRISFWLDLEGWVGVTVEEPAYLAPCDSAVRITPRKLVPSALEGITHAR
jgi:hypothetical protein